MRSSAGSAPAAKTCTSPRSASTAERASAAETVARVLSHPRLVRARAAQAEGRLFRRELPLVLTVDGVVVDGQADLVWDDGDRLVVIDYKTDVDLSPGEPSYRRQIGLYADALTKAYGRAVDAVLLRV